MKPQRNLPQSKLSNPAVARLFREVNPFLAEDAATALRNPEPLAAVALATPLLEPLFILACAARDLHGASPVDSVTALRNRLAEEVAPNSNSLAEQLLNGASFSRTAAAYPPVARNNCEPNEVQIEYVPLGARFKFRGTVVRYGRLLDKTPSRAVVQWEGAPQRREFTDSRTGAPVVIETDGARRSSVALSTPVIPVHVTVADADREWVTNAWKELTGVYE